MPNKSLGQHWLKDRLILEAIADSVPLVNTDTVLEVGPGLGTLTSALLRRTGAVIAVEYDAELARKLPAQFPGKNLLVHEGDFLNFDLMTLPEGYRFVANVPYYITQKIIEHVLKSENKPEYMSLLVQEEVARKLASQPGRMTAISNKLQFFYEVQVGIRVPKEYFTPPPKVDSQVVVCRNRHVDNKVGSKYRLFVQVVDAGFSAPRKKLRSTLSGSLRLERAIIEKLGRDAKVDLDKRAQDLSVDEWLRIVDYYQIEKAV